MTATVPGPAHSVDDIRLALRSWPEVETYLESCKAVIVPLGSTEQHGSQIEAGESGVHAVLDGILSLAGLTPACSPSRGLCC